MKLGGEVIERLVIESNRIEGIYGLREEDVLAFKSFLSLPVIDAQDVINYTDTITGGYGKLRKKQGMNVKVGNYYPPAGGPEIPKRLTALVSKTGELTPWAFHCQYEALHPFMDGNGRSGRVVWAWMMLRQGKESWLRQLGFLHSFYYQTLSEVRHD